jgi:hypothetical protein
MPLDKIHKSIEWLGARISYYPRFVNICSQIDLKKFITLDYV